MALPSLNSEFQNRTPPLHLWYQGPGIIVEEKPQKSQQQQQQKKKKARRVGFVVF